MMEIGSRLDALGRACRLLRAQAAMEYLTTYGWALLIIFIVIAALVALNPVSTPTSCRFDQVGFGCPNLPTMDTAGNLFMRVSNMHNNDIRILGMVCTENKASTPPSVWPPLPGPSPNGLLPRQSYISVNDAPFRAVCRKTDGSANYKQGEEFSGRLWIKYENVEDPASYPDRVTSASISMKVA